VVLPVLYDFLLQLRERKARKKTPKPEPVEAIGEEREQVA
jgi:hypothetical protein